MPFTFDEIERLPGLRLVKPERFEDGRGWFMEAYRESDFRAHGIGPFPQANHSHSNRRGTVRGLHYQLAPAAQGKLVRVLHGKLFDVAVDIRKGSPTFAEWYATELSAAEGTMLWIPPGFAHGVMTLEDETEIEYKVSHEYSQPHERAIQWDDPEIAIDWPDVEPILSQKDANAPPLSEADNDFVWEAEA